MQHNEKRQLYYAETKVTMPPPAYSAHQAPPPRYESHGVMMMMTPTAHELEKNDGDDSWSVLMHQSFHKRWGYLFRSWCHVFQQDRGVFHACLFCFVLLIIVIVTVMVFILF